MQHQTAATTAASCYVTSDLLLLRHGPDMQLQEQLIKVLTHADVQPQVLQATAQEVLL
jgi:hypothetical protein